MAFDPIISHESLDGADCCGCLIVNVRGYKADLVCKECGAVTQTVPLEWLIWRCRN